MTLTSLATLSLLLLLLPGLLSPKKSSINPYGCPERPELRGWLWVPFWINVGYCRLIHRVRTNGWAPLPAQGPAILISNHTCGIDHLVLQSGSRRVLGFMIAREYYEWWPIRGFCRLVGCIPVNRDGRDLQATRTALRALSNGRVLPIFPEGRITPASGDVIGELQSGAAFLALRSRVPVIPAYILGTPPTNLIGRSLLTPSSTRVVFGSPLDLSEFATDRAGDKQAQSEVTERFRLALLSLRDSCSPTNTDSFNT